MMGTILALAVGPEIHIASKLISRHFATTNILPKPSHPQNLSDSDDRIRGRSLHFIKNDTKLIVSYLNHGIVCWDLKESLKLWTINPTFRHIGYSSLSPDGSHILVFNLEGGMVIFSVSKLTMLRRFHYPVNQSRNEPVTTVFLNNAQHVACGLYNGTINISHVRTGTVVQTLENVFLIDSGGSDGFVKAMAVIQCDGHEIIAAATAEKKTEAGHRAENRRYCAEITQLEWSAHERIEEAMYHMRILSNDEVLQRRLKVLFAGTILTFVTFYFYPDVLRSVHPAWSYNRSLSLIANVSMEAFARFKVVMEIAVWVSWPVVTLKFILIKIVDIAYAQNKMETVDIKNFCCLHIAIENPHYSTPIKVKFTRVPNEKTYVPAIETILKGYYSVPICNTFVTIRHQLSTFRFRIVFRYSLTVFARSTPAMHLHGNVEFFGDILVVKMGVRQTYVNLFGGKDQFLAEHAVKEFLISCGPLFERANGNDLMIAFPLEIYAEV
ncbi:hypothetical protein BDQ17DRAFT_1330664 [Cyathus striatus]|nr:hypothetical protein BDQ17DRAFT_1330664 [Cyathus striatus]